MSSKEPSSRKPYASFVIESIGNILSAKSVQEKCFGIILRHKILVNTYSTPYAKVPLIKQSEAGEYSHPKVLFKRAPDLRTHNTSGTC